MAIKNYLAGNKKYLYFRTTDALADDDDTAASGLIPTDSITGMHPTTDATLRVYFTPKIPFFSDGSDNNYKDNDFIQIEVTANKHKEVMKAIVDSINDEFGDPFIIVGDDTTGEYLHADITGIGAINIDGGIEP